MNKSIEKCKQYLWGELIKNGMEIKDKWILFTANCWNRESEKQKHRKMRNLIF